MFADSTITLDAKELYFIRCFIQESRHNIHQAILAQTILSMIACTQGGHFFGCPFVLIAPKRVCNTKINLSDWVVELKERERTKVMQL